MPRCFFDFALKVKNENFILLFFNAYNNRYVGSIICLWMNNIIHQHCCFYIFFIETMLFCGLYFSDLVQYICKEKIQMKII